MIRKDDVQTLRLFVAIGLPQTLGLQINEQVQHWQKVWPFQKWVHPADYHLTLKFLGATSPARLSPLKQVLNAAVKGIKPFSLRLGGLGYFGETRRPRILWLGVEGELEQLRQLHQRVETHLVELGYPVEKRNFRPHLTLARNYKGKNRFEFNQSGWPERFNGELSWRVEELILYQSLLGQSPMYRIMERFPLNG